MVSPLVIGPPPQGCAPTSTTTKGVGQACGECNGRGFTIFGDTMRECNCRRREFVVARLGSFAKAPIVKASPLLTNEVDLTAENVLLSGPWEALSTHLRFVVTMKLFLAYPRVYPFRVVTDEELRRAYFAKTDRYNDTIEHDHRDLVDPRFALVVLRLGFLGYKNAAMPGILWEALRLREAADRPTWLVEDPSEPFQKGHLAFDERVGSYVDHHFRRVRIEGPHAA